MAKSSRKASSHKRKRGRKRNNSCNSMSGGAKKAKSSNKKDTKTYKYVSPDGKESGNYAGSSPVVAAKKAARFQKLFKGKSDNGPVTVKLRQATRGAGQDDMHVFKVSRKLVKLDPKKKSDKKRIDMLGRDHTYKYFTAKQGKEKSKKK